MSAPLESLRILDFSTLLPGPFATMMLADLGAEIIRIESPTHGDLVRALEPKIKDVSAWHATLNRSKRSLALDLKQPPAQKIIAQLLETHDILLEQFRPGVMSRLGLAYEQLRGHNPRLIYCSLTGYGQTGPLKNRAGHDINYLALSGIASHSGRTESGPMLPGVQIADIGAGSLMAVMGILSAVIQRQTTGVGQFIDVSMFAGAVAWNTLAAAQYFATGVSPELETELLNGGSAYDYYQTSDGRYLAIGSIEPKFWTAFCAAIERPDLLQSGGSGDATAMNNLKSEIRRIIASRSLSAWETRFAQHDACVEPVLTAGEMSEHPQTKARELLIDIPDAAGNRHKQIGHPVKYSEAKPIYRHIGAPLGAHSSSILREIGYQESEIEALRAQGVIG